MKIMERAVHNQLQEYLTGNIVLTYFSDYIYRHMDKGHMTGAVFIDLHKAFDSVDRKILLEKLSKYGILGQEIN